MLFGNVCTSRNFIAGGIWKVVKHFFNQQAWHRSLKICLVDLPCSILSPKTGDIEQLPKIRKIWWKIQFLVFLFFKLPSLLSHLIVEWPFSPDVFANFLIIFEMNFRQASQQLTPNFLCVCCGCLNDRWTEEPQMLQLLELEANKDSTKNKTKIKI